MFINLKKKEKKIHAINASLNTKSTTDTETENTWTSVKCTYLLMELNANAVVAFYGWWNWHKV